jgi:hypothetical protein
MEGRWTCLCQSKIEAFALLVHRLLRVADGPPHCESRMREMGTRNGGEKRDADYMMKAHVVHSWIGSTRFQLQNVLNAPKRKLRRGPNRGADTPLPASEACNRRGNIHYTHSEYERT